MDTHSEAQFKAICANCGLLLRGRGGSLIRDVDNKSSLIAEM